MDGDGSRPGCLRGKYVIRWADPPISDRTSAVLHDRKYDVRRVPRRATPAHSNRAAHGDHGVAGFAAKASSAPFVLPFLAYAIVVLIITRGRARPAVEKRDAVLSIAAAAIAVATVAWYVINWEATVAHFIEATRGPEALHYGSPVVLLPKLWYWISTLGVGLSPITIISAATCIVTVVSIVVAVVRLWKAPVRDRIFVAMENGTLFALVLAATILLTLLAFSLQINEDQRYVLSLIPMVAVLLSWSLSVLRQKILTAVFLCTLAASSVAVYSYSFGLYDPDDADNPWNWQLQLDPDDAMLLTTAVAPAVLRRMQIRPISSSSITQT